MPSFRTAFGTTLAAMMLLSLASARALGDEISGPEGRGTYVGIFGGIGNSSLGSVRQSGNALFAESQGGPLVVNAVGDGDSVGVGMGGLHIGHEWSGWWLGGCQQCGWAILPAAEFEGFYLGGGTQSASLNNPTFRLLPEHRFDDTFPMDSGVFLTNVVFSLQTPSRALTPYIGGGIGAANVSIRGADSPQVAPSEPGVNHFNSNPDASCWGFAAQAKAGVRLALTEHVYVFTEYRFLFVGSTEYTFGSTVSPGHAETTPWTVHFGDQFTHMGVGGIGFKF